jgi:hypothetical protein
VVPERLVRREGPAAVFRDAWGREYTYWDDPG